MSSPSNEANSGRPIVVCILISLSLFYSHACLEFEDTELDSLQCQLGCGQLCLDYLVTVPYFPIPDQKIRGTSFKVQGGGGTGNALTCVARLGLDSRILAKVADDSQGRWMVEELESNGVDTSFCVVRSLKKICFDDTI
ncbi:unnamed protein product [Thlaspi arvense]|uniref:Carbohydrate kinase PfkB domain-containing protein n=1 Tax=Thlaspi arvense TaxID=13288 RepID=A0AAU9RMH0_THLAR|nr:unnamed protein product [Thlaspi arvense]